MSIVVKYHMPEHMSEDILFKLIKSYEKPMSHIKNIRPSDAMLLDALNSKEGKEFSNEDYMKILDILLAKGKIRREKETFPGPYGTEVIMDVYVTV